MKQYKSHKVVKASRIVSTSGGPPNAANPMGSHHLVLENGATINVSGQAQFDRAERGGYFVFYPDAYTSFSPKEAFEDGYTEIAEADTSGLPG